LTPHPTGRWCKKIAGKLRYFGRWADPEGALQEYQDFLAGEPIQKAARPSSRQPVKPHSDFPLTPHPTGYWCKRIKGRLYYFGPLDDPDGALNKYLEQKDALLAGRKPRESSEGLTVKELANQFLNAKAASRESGELTRRSWQDYKDACDRLVNHFGKGRLVEDIGPEDFADLRRRMAKGWGPGTLGNVIQRMRVVFKFAFDNRLIDKPVCYGHRHGPAP